jgi:hypothetical protein
MSAYFFLTLPEPAERELEGVRDGAALREPEPELILLVEPRDEDEVPRGTLG